MPLTSTYAPNRLTGQSPDQGDPGKYIICTLPAPRDVDSRGGGYSLEPAQDGSGQINVWFMAGENGDTEQYRIPTGPDGTNANDLVQPTLDSRTRARHRTNAAIARIQQKNNRFWSK